MSLGKQRNLIVVAAVGTALLAGSVLLGGYLPGAGQSDEQVKTCPSAGTGVTCAAKTEADACAEVAPATDAYPAKPCCAAEKLAAGCEMDEPACGKAERCCEETGIKCCEQDPPRCCEERQRLCEEAGVKCCEQPVAGCCEKPEAPGGCCPSEAAAE